MSAFILAVSIQWAAAFAFATAGMFQVGLFFAVAAIATMLLAPLEDDDAEDARDRNAPWRIDR